MQRYDGMTECGMFVQPSKKKNSENSILIYLKDFRKF